MEAWPDFEPPPPSLFPVSQFRQARAVKQCKSLEWKQRPAPQLDDRATEDHRWQPGPAKADLTSTAKDDAALLVDVSDGTSHPSRGQQELKEVVGPIVDEVVREWTGERHRFVLCRRFKGKLHWDATKGTCTREDAFQYEKVYGCPHLGDQCLLVCVTRRGSCAPSP